MTDDKLFFSSCHSPCRSGGQQGEAVLRRMSQRLTPDQVVELRSTESITGALERFAAVPNLRILVAGGDGTVNWVLETLRNADARLPVAVLPLGTGNDMARTLGYGGGYKGEDVGPLLEELLSARTVLLDRWQVDGAPERLQVMNNYFSIGVDAQIAHKFHSSREEHPNRFKSRTGNKLIYGTKALSTMTSGAPAIRDCVRVSINGGNGGGTEDEELIPIDLDPAARALIVSNVPSYAAGCALSPDTRYDDGLLEPRKRNWEPAGCPWAYFGPNSVDA